MDKFRIALSGDFRQPDGTPSFPMFDLTPLQRPDIEFAYLNSTGTIDADEISDYDALILLGHTFTADSVPANDRLAIIARFGVGYDTVDVQACSDNDIALVITPAGVRRPVAVSVLAFMLALTGKLTIKNRITREGEEGWAQRSDYMGTGVTGKTLGILGFGNIGEEIAHIVRPLDMHLVTHDPFANEATLAKHNVRSVTLDALFQESDIVSINCPLNEQTHHLVNRERLAMMKPTAYIINTARGPVIDESALIHALEYKQIAGAALDVFEQEPASPDNPLFKFENVIVAPHALCWTDECFSGNGAADIEAALQVMQGNVPAGIVNKDIIDNDRWQAKLASFANRSYQ